MGLWWGSDKGHEGRPQCSVPPSVPWPFPGPPVVAFTPPKPRGLCADEWPCGCWLWPQHSRAWFQPCLWRPIFNIKTNQSKWNLYYLLKVRVNRAEGSASRKPLGFVQGITTNILHPFWDSRQPQEAAVKMPQFVWLIQGDFGACGMRKSPSPTIPHCLKASSNFQSKADPSKHLDSIFSP